jgi:hypothetical protein
LLRPVSGHISGTLRPRFHRAMLVCVAGPSAVLFAVRSL